MAEAILYARLACADQSSACDLNAQVRTLEAYAESQGFTIAKTIAPRGNATNPAIGIVDGLSLSTCGADCNSFEARSTLSKSERLCRTPQLHRGTTPRDTLYPEPRDPFCRKRNKSKNSRVGQECGGASDRHGIKIVAEFAEVRTVRRSGRTTLDEMIRYLENHRLSGVWW